MLFITGLLLLNLSEAAMVLDTLNGRFRAEFHSTDGVGSIPGFAKLSISAAFNFHFETNAHSSRWSEIDSLHQGANGVTILSEQEILYMPFNHNIPVINGEAFADIEPTLRISATPNSAFSQMVQGFFFEPLSRTEGRLHINPDSVTDLSYEGRILYSTAVIDPTWGSIWGSTNFWGVNAAINLVSPQGPIQDTEQSPLVFRPCMISNPGGATDAVTIPSSIYQILLDTISAQGLRTRRSSQSATRFILGDITPEIMASFPTIEYILPGMNEDDFTIASIPPTEYIAPTNDPRVYRLLVVRAMTTEVCILTDPIISKLVMHFDIQNNRVGFGEPLIEIM